ncbi:MAG: hypothetical protein ABJD07_04850 [Gemmatimonadaceae bacterium]
MTRTRSAIHVPQSGACLLVVDDTPQHEIQSPRVRAAMPLEYDGQRTRREKLGAFAAGAVVTIALGASMAISVRGYDHGPARGAPPAAATAAERERLVYVRPRPADVAPPPVQPPRARDRAVAARPSAGPPPDAAPRDTSAIHAPPAPPSMGDAPPTPATAPSTAPARAGGACIGPCSAAAAPAFTWGRPNAPPSRAERDSVLAVVADRVAHSQSPPAARGPGVSIAVGLPGGGPTRAQRQRDSTINADVLARMARIRARYDSARSDSAQRKP